MIILTAYSKKSGFITLTKDYRRKELEFLQRNDQFFCPQCKSELRLKAGQIVIPHFAHINNKDCLTSFSEGETADHLSGKLQLYNFFKDKGCLVELEAPIQSISQRPDLLIKLPGKKIAVEFQCSTIPIDVLVQRTGGYENINIEPLWIPRTPKTLSDSQGVRLLSISKFHQSFIVNNPTLGSSLITYDPQHKQFVYFAHLLSLHKNQFIGKVKMLPLEKQHYPFLSVKVPTEQEFRSYWRIHLTKRRQYLRTRIFLTRKGINDPLLRVCYENRLTLEELPKWIGLPIAGSENFIGHPVEWQLLLHSFFAGRVDISMGTIREFVETQKVIDRKKAIEATLSYVQLLKRIGIEISISVKNTIPEDQLFKTVFEQLVAKRYEN